MKRFIHTLILSILFFSNISDVQATDYPTDLEGTLALGLPVVLISTVDGEEPTAETSYPPAGSMGESIKNATKVPGSVKVLASSGEIIYSSGEFINKESGMTVKLRGNTSNRSAQKPYKIKLQKKGDMLGRGDKRYNDKNWVLIKSHNLKTYLGRKIGEIMGYEWMPQGIFVNLIFNGDYKGLYTLQESIERNENCRINVKEDGFIVEHDPYWWNENGEYLLSDYNPSYNYTFKFPDYEDASADYLKKIAATLRDYESSINDGSYHSLIDVTSFARWMLSHDILGSYDAGGINWYLTKNSVNDDSPIRCGPIWDFDSALYPGPFSRMHGERFDKFFNNKNSLFAQTYVELWRDIKDSLKAELEKTLEEINSDKWLAYDNSVKATNARYKAVLEADRRESVEDIRDYYATHFPEMEAAIDDLDKNLKLSEIEEIHEWNNSYKVEGGILYPLRDIPSLSVFTIDGTVVFNGALQYGESLVLTKGVKIIKVDSIINKVII